MAHTSRFPLPSALELKIPGVRSQAALGHLKVEGMKVKYVGPGNDDTQAASIRTNYPVPPDCPLYYFEVEILNKGEMGFIGVGFMTEEVQLARLPGWEAHSYGYHGDDGCAFSGSGTGRLYGPTFTTLDVIGVCFNRVDRTIKYFKNGRDLGVAFHSVQEERLFPCVGLRSQREEVLFNLGSSPSRPFQQDMEAMRSALRERVVAGVAAVQLPLTCAANPALLTSRASEGTGSKPSASKERSDSVKPGGREGSATPGAPPIPGAGAQAAAGAGAGAVPLLPKLLTDYLSHTRCWRTAAILTRDLLSKAPAEGPSSQSQASELQQPSGEDPVIAETAARKEIYDMVVAGRIEEARAALTARYGPGLLDGAPRLDFKLKVANFCELVRSGGTEALDAALSYGRSVLAPHTPKGPDDEELLADALSLLAYENPVVSPCGFMLGESARVNLAEDVNAAVLEAQGLPPISPLEGLVLQTCAVMDALKARNHPQAQLLDIRTLCLEPSSTSS